LRRVGGIVLPELHDGLDLGIGEVGALDAQHLVAVGRQVEHIAAPQQLLGAGMVDDGARIDLRADGKGDARREVGLDHAGGDVDRGPLTLSISVTTGARRCGTPLKVVSSTILGSIMSSRRRSGLLWNKRPAIKELRQTLLPDPVAPAISRCGIRARSTTTGSPETF